MIQPMTRTSPPRGGNMRKTDLGRWAMGLAPAGFMIYVPYLYYRYTLEHSKRFRPIVQGRVSRCGCLSAYGFDDAILKHRIKSCITCLNEATKSWPHADRCDSTS